MKKLVEKLLSWCKKSMKMRRCVGKSTAPVTGQSVGQTGNAEGVLPSTATETVDEIVLPAAVETAGMVETIDEKAAFGKSGRKKPENMLDALQRFLTYAIISVTIFSLNRRSIVGKRCRMKSMP